MTQRPEQDLETRVQTLEQEVSDLKMLVKQLQASTSGVQPGPVVLARSVEVAKASVPDPVPASNLALTPDDRKTISFLHDTTINLGLDTYYDYNFNNPVGRVNLLRAYDVLSNEFSLNQASVIMEHAPDVAAGRRWGGRLDLQFGQATDTLQGNPANEPRPPVWSSPHIPAHFDMGARICRAFPI